jgi:hypothetical protein
MVKENRMRFPRIRTPQQDDVGLLYFPVRACAATRSEYRRQTGDAGCVSSPVTAINIVRTHHGADEFLCRIVQFVGGFGTTEHAEISRIVFFD